MKDVDVNQYRSLLVAKRSEIVGRSRLREDLWIVQSNEEVETVQMAGDREFAPRSLERETKTLMQVTAALQRIEDGDYGVCLECEEPISPKRLAAVPWAAYCLTCQELHDRLEDKDEFEPKLAA